MQPQQLETGKEYQIPSRAAGFYVGRFVGMERGRFRFDVDQYGIYAVLTGNDLTQVIEPQRLLRISKNI